MKIPVGQTYPRGIRQHRPVRLWWPFGNRDHIYGNKLHEIVEVSGAGKWAVVVMGTEICILDRPPVHGAYEKCEKR
jgi:hypothetical protein